MLLLATAASAHAFAGPSIDSISAAYGHGQGSADIYRIGARSGWDRSWFSEGNWQVSGFWEVEAGHWHSDKPGAHEDNAFELALTPVFRLEHKDAYSGRLTLYVEAGIGLHMIGPTSIGDRSLSSMFQFGTHLGAGIRFGEQGKYDLGYRYQHLSNAGLDSPNNGLDIHTLSIGMRY